MINKKLKLLTGSLVVALSSCASAAPEPQNAECVAGITNLLKLVSRPEFYNESSENFIKNSATFLHIEKNETSPRNNLGERYTTITLKSESWLSSGTLRFSSADTLPMPQNAKFLEADFEIKQICSPKYKDFSVLATKNIKGKFTEHTSPAPDQYTLRVWSTPDPEDGWERRTEVSETSAFLGVKVARTIASDEDVAE